MGRRAVAGWSEEGERGGGGGLAEHEGHAEVEVAAEAGGVPPNVDFVGGGHGGLVVQADGEDVEGLVNIARGEVAFMALTLHGLHVLLDLDVLLRGEEADGADDVDGAGSGGRGRGGGGGGHGGSSVSTTE